MHQHLQPVRDDRRRPDRPQRARQGIEPQAVGQDLARPRLAGRGRLPQGRGPPGRSRRARLPAGRLRLRHLHRQLRTAAARDLRSHQRQRPDRHRRAVRKPQLRRPHQPGRQDELPGLPAAGHRLRARRHDGLRLRDPAARHRRGRQRRVLEGHLAHQCRGRRRGRRQREPRDVPQGLRLRVRRRPPLEGPRRARRRAVRMGRAFDVRAQADLLRRHEGHAGASRRHPRRPRAGVARRLGHHRPHFPGGRVQGVQPGRQVPDRARRGAEELQLLWLASRQPRDYGAWYLRQHPPAQPAARLRRRGGHAGRVHLRFHDWKAFDDL